MNLPEYIIAPPISEQPGAKPRFGRLKLLDTRSLEYPMEPQVRSKRVGLRKQRKWRKRWHGTQGNYPYCTAYAALHYFEHEPVNHPRSYGKYKGKPTPLFDPRVLYCAAQQKDPWPGGCGQSYPLDSYDGTSLSAMLAVMKDFGMVTDYYWEFKNVDTIIKALLTTGPVMVGTNWYSDMLLDGRGKIKNKRDAIITPTGSIEGGHAYILDEIDLTPKNKDIAIGMFNSWESWGYGGTSAYMSLDSLETLMREDGSEFALATEAA